MGGDARFYHALTAEESNRVERVLNEKHLDSCVANQSINDLEMDSDQVNENPVGGYNVHNDHLRRLAEIDRSLIELQRSKSEL